MPHIRKVTVFEIELVLNLILVFLGDWTKLGPL